MRRRSVLAAPALLAGFRAGAQPAPVEGPGLHRRAAAKGLAFGAAVATRHLEEADTVVALREECGLIVAEFEHKWHRLEPRRGEHDFAPGDRLAAFARDNGMALRGHTLVWHRSMPPWTTELERAELAAAVRSHIAAAVGRWRGQIRTWDVLNEAVRPEDGRADLLRQTPMLERLGPEYVAEVFRLARAADPTLRLCYNDFGCEHASAWGRRKRQGVLMLLGALRQADAPLDVLGVQAHLDAHRPFEAEEWRAFLSEVAGLGLTIEVTEFDVNDARLPADPAVRDAAVAELTRRFLDATLSEPAVKSLVCWGLSDRHSWIRRGQGAEHRREDGAAARPLPLDEAMQRKPMWAAIAAALDAAPARQPA
jgi:endo-1,4-beta-xylanase